MTGTARTTRPSYTRAGPPRPALGGRVGGRRQPALAPGPVSLRPLAAEEGRDRSGEWGSSRCCLSTPHPAGHTPGTWSPRTEALLRKANQSVRSAGPWNSKTGQTVIREAEKPSHCCPVSGPPPGSPSLRTTLGRLTCRGPRGHCVAS